MTMQHQTAGTELTQNEYEAETGAGAHVVNSQARGDLLISNTAATGFKRLAKGTAAQRLLMDSSANDPEWGGDATEAELTELTDASETALHSHASAAARLGAATQAMVEGGRGAYYMWGGRHQPGMSTNDIVGLGLTVHIGGTGSLDTATNAELPGGTDMFVTANGDDAGFAGSNQLAAADDWILGCRIKQGGSAAGQDFILGLRTTPSTFTDENDSIGWRKVDTGNFIGFSDSGGTESTVDSSNNDTSEHTLRVEISGGGASISFYFDDTIVGSAVTTNIPSGTTLSNNCGVTGSDAADHSFYMSDFYTFRGN